MRLLGGVNMKTTVYLVRHSEPMKKPINVVNSDSLQVCNEKSPLSINGERKALILSESNELKDIDMVISSNYVRSISTAKYIADKNNKDLYINEMFGERKHGINSWDELPQEFESKQMNDPDFKIGNGESQYEVAERMHEALLEVVHENRGKRIAIVSHATAIMFLFMKFGTYFDNKLYFDEQVLIDEDFKWNAPEVFKLEFEDDNLISIENIKY